MASNEPAPLASLVRRMPERLPPGRRRLTRDEYKRQRLASKTTHMLYKYRFDDPRYLEIRPSARSEDGRKAPEESNNDDDDATLRAPPALDAVQLHEKIQRIVHKPATTPQELDDKVKEYQAVIDDLKARGWRVLRTLLCEQELPEGAPRTLVPSSMGGVLSGDKFLYQGLFIKLARLGERSPLKSLYAAYKVARHDFRSSELLQQLWFPNLVVPVQILYRIRGRTVTVQVSVPISEQSLRYGSPDGGRTVRCDPESHAYETAVDIAEDLRLAPHVVNKHDNVLFLPMDMELHQSPLDGREIAVDVSRLLPSTEEGTTDDAGEHFYQSPHVFHRLFRPEFMRSHFYCPDPPRGELLSSDQFSNFGFFDRAQDIRGLDAVEHLREVLIPHVARKLRPHSDLCAELHEAGVNMRYLGEVLLCIVRNEERRATAMHVLREMVRRAFKERLYEMFATIPFTSSDKVFKVAGCKLALEAQRGGMMAWLRDKYENLEVDEVLVGEALDKQAMLDEILRQVCGEAWTMGLPRVVKRWQAERVLLEEVRLRAENLDGDEKHPQLASTYRALLDLYGKWSADEPDATAAKAERVIQWLREVVETRLSDGEAGVVDALEETYECYFAIAWYYKERAQYEASEEMWRACLAVKEEEVARDGEEAHWVGKATVWGNLAIVHRRQGKYDAALEMYERLLQIKEARLGALHPDVATTLNNMAAVYDVQGKRDTALDMYGRALKIREARLGAEHPDVAVTLNNMAIVSADQGKYDAALEMYGRALRIKEARLGADHPDVASTLNNMAGVYQSQGCLDAALEMHGRALTIFEARLGADHPHVASTLHNLAVVYQTQGKHDAALEMYGRALTILEARLGAEHPEVAMTLFNMAVLHESQGRLDAAVDMVMRSRDIYLHAGQAHVVAKHHSVVLARLASHRRNAYIEAQLTRMKKK